MHFYYSPDQMPIRTMFPIFYTFPDFMPFSGGPYKNIKSVFNCNKFETLELFLMGSVVSWLIIRCV